MRPLRIAGAIFLVVGAGALLLAASFVPLLGRAYGPGDIFDAEKRTLLPGLLGSLAAVAAWGLWRARPWALVASAILATAALLAGAGLLALSAIGLYVFGDLALPAFLVFGAIGAVTVAGSLLVLEQLRRGFRAAWPVTGADVRGFVAIATILLLAGLGHAVVVSRDAAITADRLAEREVAQDLQGHVQVNARILDSSVGVSRQEADLGTEGTREVRVRVVEHLELEVTLSSDVDAVFRDEPPHVCLWTRAWDRQGDPCWGQPDLEALVTAQLRGDGTGPAGLVAGRPITVRTSLDRDPNGCDFPPGEWIFEFIAYPVGGGGNAVEVQVRLDVPLAGESGLLTGELSGVRFCADPAGVVNVQGEPA